MEMKIHDEELYFLVINVIYLENKVLDRLFSFRRLIFIVYLPSFNFLSTFLVFNVHLLNHSLFIYTLKCYLFIFDYWVELPSLQVNTSVEVRTAGSAVYVKAVLNRIMDKSMYTVG